MKVFVKTFGCTLNQGDSEVLKGVLSREHSLVSSESDADVVIVNSCGVKSVTQSKVLDYVRAASKKGKVVVGGCLPGMLDVKKHVPGVLAVFDANSITRINELLEKPGDLFSSEKESRISERKFRQDSSTAIVPIAQGCLGSCSYCSVKFARGRLRSYAKEEVLKEVGKALADGCTLIKLTAQDTGCWGKDFGSNLPDLLSSVLSLDGNFRVRLGMMNPNYALECLDELIEIYNDVKMVKFLHIPVQSGSDKILGDMGRSYTAEDFKKVVGEFRKKVKGISISTDVIAGFPTETEEEFEKTVQLVREVKPEVLNISMFAPRPKTEAAEMKQLRTQTIKERSMEVSKEYKKIRKAY